MNTTLTKRLLVLASTIASLFVLAFPLFLSNSAEAAGTIFVDLDATSGSNSGADWANAYTDLQTALASATAGDEIWVATGTYTPGSLLTHTFTLTDGVGLYGGFAATETVRSQRDWVANETILSGDYGNDDIKTSSGALTETAGIVGTNAANVVSSFGVTTTAVLDGFTITSGSAKSLNGCRACGGGLYNNGGSPTLSNLLVIGNLAKFGAGLFTFNSSPTLTNITFSGNLATGGGGAIYNANGHLELIDVAMLNNIAIDSGGGMFNTDSSKPVLTNVLIQGNSSGYGGGIYSVDNSEPTLTNVVLSGNEAIYYGGGLFNNGGTNSRRVGVPITNHPVLTNVTISGNSAGEGGGGIYNYLSSPMITNSIIWNNQAISVTNTTTATMHNEGSSSPTFTHSLIANSGGSGASWETILGIDNGNNLDTDPLFQLAIDPMSAPTNVGDLQLQTDSPAIDAGLNVSYTSSVLTDLVGNDRIQNSIIDIGAYEISFYNLELLFFGSGIGSVSEINIGCTGDCSQPLAAGTVVTLTALAEPSSTFDGWSGAGCSGTGDCIVTLNETKYVTATFTLKSYALTTSVSSGGDGSGMITRSPEALTYTHGTTVTLTATADAGSAFLGWTGAGCSGTGACVVTMDGEQSIQAAFEQIIFKLYLPLIVR
ncbi:MAG: choice-of-anchor Q domain-containing protein [Anaerolineae bacterium]